MTDLAPTLLCPSCAYDLSYLSPAEDLTCPECGGRCLGAAAREAAAPRRRVGTIVDVLMFLVLGPPILAAGLFAIGLVPIMLYPVPTSAPALALMAIGPLALLAYAVSMSLRLWPKRQADRRAGSKASSLRVLIVLSLLFNMGWTLALGYMLVVLAALSSAVG